MRLAMMLTLSVYLLGLPYLSAADAQSSAQTAKESLSQVSEKGLFQVTITLPGKTLRVGKNGAEIQVRDKDGKEVAGARITALPLIFRHGESGLIRPRVSEKSGGWYLIENIYIETPGHWVLRITIQKDGHEDRLEFDFPEVKRES